MLATHTQCVPALDTVLCWQHMKSRTTHCSSSIKAMHSSCWRRFLSPSSRRQQRPKCKVRATPPPPLVLAPGYGVSQQANHFNPVVCSACAVAACLPRNLLAAAALRSLRPGLVGGWCGPWSAQAAGASCRLQPPAGPAAAETPQDTTQSSQQQRAASSTGTSGEAAAGGAAAGKSKQPVCSLGQQFLQSYLDSLGSLNTFG